MIRVVLRTCEGEHARYRANLRDSTSFAGRLQSRRVGIGFRGFLSSYVTGRTFFAWGMPCLLHDVSKTGCVIFPQALVGTLVVKEVSYALEKHDEVGYTSSGYALARTRDGLGCRMTRAVLRLPLTGAGISGLWHTSETPVERGTEREHIQTASQVELSFSSLAVDYSHRALASSSDWEQELGHRHDCVLGAGAGHLDRRPLGSQEEGPWRHFYWGTPQTYR